MFVCLSVGLSAFYRPHDICPLCGAASEWPREQDQPSSGAARRERASACTCESTRAHAVQLLYEKIAALMPFKNKTVRARACCRIRNCREFQKKREKENQHATSHVQFTVRLLLECLLFESY